jgi:hypothetical protein
LTHQKTHSSLEQPAAKAVLLRSMSTLSSSSESSSEDDLESEPSMEELVGKAPTCENLLFIHPLSSEANALSPSASGVLTSASGMLGVLPWIRFVRPLSHEAATSCSRVLSVTHLTIHDARKARGSASESDPALPSSASRGSSNDGLTADSSRELQSPTSPSPSGNSRSSPADSPAGRSRNASGFSALATRRLSRSLNLATAVRTRKDGLGPNDLAYTKGDKLMILAVPAANAKKVEARSQRTGQLGYVLVKDIEQVRCLNHCRS